MTIEYKDRKLIEIIDMAYPNNQSFDKKKERRRSYRSISSSVIRSERGDQDTMSRSSQWLSGAWEEVRIN